MGFFAFDTVGLCMCTTYAWALDWTGAYILCVKVTCACGVKVGAGGYRTTVKNSVTAGNAF